MTNDIISKAIDLAASYFANWKYYDATLDHFEASRYREKYDGAIHMAALMGIEQTTIESVAWEKYGDEIGKAYDANHASW